MTSPRKAVAGVSPEQVVSPVAIASPAYHALTMHRARLAWGAMLLSHRAAPASLAAEPSVAAPQTPPSSAAFHRVHQDPKPSAWIGAGHRQTSCLPPQHHRQQPRSDRGQHRCRQHGQAAAPVDPEVRRNLLPVRRIQGAFRPGSGALTQQALRTPLPTICPKMMKGALLQVLWVCITLHRRWKALTWPVQHFLSPWRPHQDCHKWEAYLRCLEVLARLP